MAAAAARSFFSIKGPEPLQAPLPVGMNKGIRPGQVPVYQSSNNGGVFLDGTVPVCSQRPILWMFYNPDDLFGQYLGSVNGGKGQIPAQGAQFRTRHNGHPHRLFL